MKVLVLFVIQHTDNTRRRNKNKLQPAAANLPDGDCLSFLCNEVSQSVSQSVSSVSSEA